jgi:hypothetical protein
MQISYDDLERVDGPTLDLLHAQDRAVCSVLTKAGRQGWYRWRTAADRNGELAFELVTDENPPAFLARLTPRDLSLNSGDFARTVWERLN